MNDHLEDLAHKLEQTGDYRVLRRFRPAPRSNIVALKPSREAVVIDVETTGLDPRSDETIELAMVRFAFSDDGHVLAVGPSFQQLRQPSTPIPIKITSLTGLTDEMVYGHTINLEEVSSYIAGAELIIAHHARFDRAFAERLHADFAGKSWACSMAQVDWESAGCRGRKLEYLLSAAGLFHDSHRGAADCLATLELLSRPLGITGRTALAHLLDEALRTTWRLRAIGAPFAHKDLLKARGYIWNNGDDGCPRTWFVDLREEAVDGEIDFLRAAVFRPDWQPDLIPITALSRFSQRV